MRGLSAAVLIYVLKDTLFFPKQPTSSVGWYPWQGHHPHYPYISVSCLLNILNFISVQFINNWEAKGRLSLFSYPTHSSCREGPTIQVNGQQTQGNPVLLILYAGLCVLIPTSFCDHNLHGGSSPRSPGTNFMNSIFTFSPLQPFLWSVPWTNSLWMLPCSSFGPGESSCTALLLLFWF